MEGKPPEDWGREKRGGNTKIGVHPTGFGVEPGRKGESWACRRDRAARVPKDATTICGKLVAGNSAHFPDWR